MIQQVGDAIGLGDTVRLKGLGGTDEAAKVVGLLESDLDGNNFVIQFIESRELGRAKFRNLELVDSATQGSGPASFILVGDNGKTLGQWTLKHDCKSYTFFRVGDGFALSYGETFVEEPVGQDTVDREVEKKKAILSRPSATEESVTERIDLTNAHLEVVTKLLDKILYELQRDVDE